jgi:hypothetical protein
MAIVEVNVPEHQLGFFVKQLGLLGYAVVGTPAVAASPAEKLASPAQKTFIKAFEELKAAQTTAPQWQSAEALAQAAIMLADKSYGPGL